ncbi:hypothetical protein QE408_002131 [Agrobacterium larrymoorei]|uniref:Uncharacterized protein n=1 Tax=Agrobacterium larrymoorei TaxID=160699 RepID=A0ABU0UJI5_9HYPH|nr:hypothetical protein [Agrobacterium larrymoorei]
MRQSKAYCFDPAVRPNANGTAATIRAIIGDEAKIRLASEVMATERTTGNQFDTSEAERDGAFRDALSFSTSRRTSSRSRRSSAICARNDASSAGFLPGFGGAGRLSSVRSVPSARSSSNWASSSSKSAGLSKPWDRAGALIHISFWKILGLPIVLRRTPSPNAGGEKRMQCRSEEARRARGRASYWTHKDAQSSLIHASCFPKIESDFPADAAAQKKKATDGRPLVVSNCSAQAALAALA